MMDEHLKAILHLCDCNLQDRYYEVPVELLKELKQRIERDGMGAAWSWWTEQADFDGTEPNKPIKYGTVNMTLPTYFLDFSDPQESLDEWTFLEGS